MSDVKIHRCCVSGFAHGGTPTGRVEKLGGNQTYVAGESGAAAGVLLIHDIFGWEFVNLRLLADQIAREAGVTVYLPDFFGGESLPTDLIFAGRFDELDLPRFMAANAREVREPELFACARAMRSERGHVRVGALGYCYGGWAVFRLGAREHSPPLVDCISTGHPSLLTAKDMDEVAVPFQVLAPEIDPTFTAELKLHCFRTMQTAGVPSDYQHFSGVEHACFTRGDPNKAGERDAMARGKQAAVDWFRWFLREPTTQE